MDIVGHWAEAPKKDQWVERDKLMLRLDADANISAEKAAKRGSSYVFSDEALHQSQNLRRELENCFRCGNWLSAIVMSASTIETFLHCYLKKGSKTNGFLEEINFPFPNLYKEVIDARNSILHLRNRSYADSFFKLSREAHFELAKRAMWLSFFLVDYVLFIKKS